MQQGKVREVYSLGKVVRKTAYFDDGWGDDRDGLSSSFLFGSGRVGRLP